MGRHVLGLQEIDPTPVTDVGGPGAHPGELSRSEALRVPAGWCVTTAAFRPITAEAPAIADLRRGRATDTAAVCSPLRTAHPRRSPARSGSGESA
jgi:phosphoenolpyruvate synthase/pyruvate phosphate dikinase